MATENHTCIFCQSQSKCDKELNTYIMHIDCPNCGKYRITLEANQYFPQNRIHDEKKYLISGYLREMTDLKLQSEVITSDNIDTILNSAKIPITVVDKFNKMLLYLNRHTKYLGHEIPINENHPAIAYALNSLEIKYLFNALKEYNYINIIYSQVGNKIADNKIRSVSLTLIGIDKANELLKATTETDTCFVAIWFNDEMMSIFDDYISKAVTDSGYRPLVISRKEHNDDICDQIIAEIRKCKFLIADFTGHRGGVYYEAGFAYGLGKEVIHTCRKDWFDKGIHFDLEHRNFIIWKTGEELYEKLKNRIGATIVK